MGLLGFSRPADQTMGRPVRSRRYSLRGLAAALVIVLIVDAAALLGAIALPLLGILGEFGFLLAMVIFVVWFVPVANLWVPFQMMADIWRAGLPAQARANRVILP